ncbi:hypothetical protein SRABI106_02031 [Rahnella aquatilis]|nr:hypothetical protein SRABI106_02031 [Rahnella aquatilis]
MASGSSNAQLSILRPGKSHAVTAHALPTPVTPTITATPASKSPVFFNTEGSTKVMRLSQCEKSACVACQISATIGVSTPSAIPSAARCSGVNNDCGPETRPRNVGRRSDLLIESNFIYQQARLFTVFHHLG